MMAAILHLISMATYLSYVQVVFTRKASLASELDLLWNKYGEVRGQLAILESETSLDRNKIESFQQQLTALQDTITDIEGEVTQIAADLKVILSLGTAQDDETNHTDNPVWKDFSFILKRGSVQMNASYIVHTVDIETDGPFSHIWYDNHIPILDDDLFTRVDFSGENIHTLELRGIQSSAIRDGQKEISLEIENKIDGIIFRFNSVKHSFVRVYDYPLTYRVGPLHPQTNVTSGSFELRSEVLRNREITPSVNFFGLNGSQFPYKSVTARSWLGSDGVPQGPGKILNITNGSKERGTYKFTFDILEMVYDNGGIFSYIVTIPRFDDVFRSVKYVMHDPETLRHDVATLPEGSMVFLRDLFPREFKLGVGDSSLLHCSAMGNPKPRMAILKLKRDGHETTTGYSSVVMKRKYITTVMLVVKPTVPEVANISFVCAATSDGRERRLSLPTKIVVPPRFLKYEVYRGLEENVIVQLFVERSDPPKPSVSCRENDDWGDFIWGKSPMYTANETSTTTGYIVTFNVNMAATTTPPTRFVCEVFSVNGHDRIIVPIHL
ncbi:uncharacterized protein LOC110455121 [Mizuhopecten yessoensis]|uniref:Ig-like domain-containing protein n=1 Tax=Mizuhopecten yessoensis TaxID=6573 RepID=A0A210QDY3_MIZYE|nr:uncharacterized protein LOC110455121 [Mizuhopecten yessoensis]OWF46878.1 hypothetical protein KP79_PYT07122 [Mizuhopecten yessoensis]